MWEGLLISSPLCSAALSVLQFEARRGLFVELRVPLLARSLVLALHIKRIRGPKEDRPPPEDTPNNHQNKVCTRILVHIFVQDPYRQMEEVLRFNSPLRSSKSIVIWPI